MPSTRMKTKTNVQELVWNGIFPMNPTINYTHSTAFMKQLVLVGISTITYLKKVYPAESFLLHKYDDLTIPVLKDKSSCEKANWFASTIKDTFETIDKNYLKEMVLVFYEDDILNSVLESYTFTYKYNKEEIMIQSSGTNNSVNKSYKTNIKSIKDTTRDLLTTCHMVNNSQTLPDNFTIGLKLIYNDSTPPDYEPKGFKSVYEDTTNNSNYNLGKVTTPWHRLGLKAYIKRQTVENVSPNKNNSSPVYEDEYRGYVSQDKFSNYPQYQSQTCDNTNKLESHLQSMQLSSQEVSGVPMSNVTQNSIRCPCTKTHDDNYHMVKCRSCDTWQHAACFGLLKENESQLEAHCCDICAANSTQLKCSDPKLVNTDILHKKGLCLFRSALSYCLNYQEVDMVTLMEALSISRKTANALIQKMASKKVFRQSTPYSPDDIDKSYFINTQHLQNYIIPAYFSNNLLSSSHISEMESNFDVSHNTKEARTPANVCTPNIISQKSIQKNFNSFEDRNNEFNIKSRLNLQSPPNAFGNTPSPTEDIDTNIRKSKRIKRPSIRLSEEGPGTPAPAKRMKRSLKLQTINRKE